MLNPDKALFISKFGNLMSIEARRLNYKVVSTAIAQTILESAWGKSKLSIEAHNYWGLKTGNNWDGECVTFKTREEVNGRLIEISANFRKYSSDEEGVKGYYSFISKKRYKNLKDARYYREYAEMLKKDGYATSSSYVKNLCRVVEEYDLFEYDLFLTDNPYKPTVLESSIYNPYVKLLQNCINHVYGNNYLKVDGYFGPNTKNAVLRFQKEHNLKIDGIVGTNTWKALTS